MENAETTTDTTGEQPQATPATQAGGRRAGARRSDAEISSIMRRVHGTDTTPELRLRQALAARGISSQGPSVDLPGKPDLVFADTRLAVFVDGDYWHGNQWRRRGHSCLEEQFRATAREETRAYWLRKIRRNMQRDCDATTALLRLGWRVLRLWESQISADLDACAAQITRILAEAPFTTNMATIAEAGATYQVSQAPQLPEGTLAEKTCAEFFAGIGLMRLGLERADWSVVFANDIDTAKHAFYTGHFGADDAAHFALGDVHMLTAEQLPTVTLATASFPCNDLSLAGAREGLAGKHSSAFWGFIQALAGLGTRRPPLVLLENVPGFLTSHGGADFQRALQALNDRGYVVDAFLLDAARFVPQSRRRLFVVGQRADLLSDGLPDSSSAPRTAAPANMLATVSDTRPAALTAFIAAHPEIAWRIRQLPAPPTASAQRLADLLDNLPDDAPQWWSASRTQRLLGQMSVRHRALAERLIAADEGSYGTIFRRTRNGVPMAELRADGVAGCLRTPRGGSARQILFKAGFGRVAVRLLTGREAARLMGAADYTLTGSEHDALFGFGDAVCAPVITWIATYYLNPLLNELLRGRLLSA
ncbi:MAG: DNA (cytosine-5-)-methyltransferase [Ktedonobacterales bacterium]